MNILFSPPRYLFYNPAYIYEVSQYKQSHAPLEDFNQLAWFPIEEAISKLKRGSHNGELKCGKES